MSKSNKLILFVIIVSVVTIALVVFRYERLLKEEKKIHWLGSVKGGTPAKKEYTAQEIIALIKNCKEYIGDSITIFDNGDILSSNAKFQGTMEAVMNTKDNMQMVRANMESNKLPVQYNIYLLAAIFYRQANPNEFKK